MAVATPLGPILMPARPDLPETVLPGGPSNWVVQAGKGHGIDADHGNAGSCLDVEASGAEPEFAVSSTLRP